MNLLSIARVPAVIVSPEDTVMQALDASIPVKVGAVAVVDNEVLKGIFSERDLMLKVVHKRLDPDATKIKEVMTSPVITVSSTVPPREVLQLMLEKHFRHLPVSDDGMTVKGMLSIRHLLQFLVNDLTENLDHMEAFIGADSPGG